MDKEVWCDVKGYEGLYQVSNMGRVKSLNYNHTGKEKLLKPVKCGNDYLCVILCRGGKYKHFRLHRLVLMAFNPCDNMESLQINHIDENKTNNHLSNLEWTTCKENINHGTRTFRAADKLRGKFNTKKSIPIAQLTLEGKLVKAWKSSHDAKREGGFHQGNINSCCKGKLKTHKGYRWCYLSEFLDKHNGIIE